MNSRHGSKDEPEWLEQHRNKQTWREEVWDESREDVGTYGHYMSRSEEDMRETGLLRDVAFNRHSMNDGQHISPYDNNTIQIGTDGIQVKLVQGIDVQTFKQVLAMAQHATTGVNLNVPLPGDWEPCEEFKRLWTVRGGARQYGGERDGLEDPSKYTDLGCRHGDHRTLWSAPGGNAYEGQMAGDDWEEMLEGGLQHGLETQTVVFAVSGISRACTHQLVRSRRAGFHQQSQRATWYGDFPEVRMPESIWRHPDRSVRDAFMEAVYYAHRAYTIACDADVSYQDARYALPEGTTNYILCEYTIREFIAVYAYRACSMFNWEIVHVVREMGRLLKEAHPFLEKHIKISCEKTIGAKDSDKSHPIHGDAHTCTFQGWERVEGQCDFPWARDSNRAFRSKAHEIGPARTAFKLTPIQTEPYGHTGVRVEPADDRCPSCGVSDPSQHPLESEYGEVLFCPDPFHAPVIHKAYSGRVPKHAEVTYTLTTDPDLVTCPQCLSVLPKSAT